MSETRQDAEHLSGKEIENAAVYGSGHRSAGSRAQQLAASAPPLAQQLLFLIVAAGVLVVDQLSKYVVRMSLPLYHSFAPVPTLEAIFRFTHTTNTGAAFGLFPGGGNLFAILAVAVSIVIVYYNFTLPAGSVALRLTLGLQLGGAIGNLIDRLLQGRVTDFLDFGPWPVFNLADTAIVTGVLVLAWLTWREGQVAPDQETQPDRQEITADESVGLP